MGNINCNIITYEDDICLIVPSVSALQYMVNIFCKLVNGLNLKININKFDCIEYTKFRKFLFEKTAIKWKHHLLRILLQNFNIQSNLCYKNNIIQKLNQFYTHFSSVLTKLNFANKKVKLKLLNDYFAVS